MIEIDGKIVSTDLLTEHFCCDIAACKGQCCIDGDSGAPLDIEEVDILEQEYENYKPYMTPEGIAAVEQQGFMVVDADGDYTTPLVNGCECAYTFVNEQGITLCAIEAACRAGNWLNIAPSAVVKEQYLKGCALCAQGINHNWALNWFNRLNCK